MQRKAYISPEVTVTRTAKEDILLGSEVEMNFGDLIPGETLN